MIFHKLGFSEVMSENEKAYLMHLEGIISSVDTNASAEVIRRPAGLSVRISPSSYELFALLLSEVKKFHTLLSIHVDFSKSMRAGNNIFFNINF